jgi:hypothetical protein
MTDSEKDPIMKSINKSLQNPIVSGSVMPDNIDNASMVSNVSNISGVSSISSVNTSSLYTIRQERRMDLYDYFKQTVRVYLSEIAYHSGITLAVSILGGIIGTGILYGWSLIVSAFLVVIYGVMVSSNLSSIVRAWRHDRSDGINRFWAACMVMAYKNALILQEYIDLYQFSLRSDNRRKNDLTDNEVFMIDDPNFNFIHPSEVKKILQRIHSYVRLAYELGHLKQTDNLTIQRNVVYCNVSDQSLTDERNRRIEKLLNRLNPQRRADIIDSWNAIDKKHSTRNQSMTFIPFRWMIYEYRNLFRYLNSSSDLRKIYNNVGLNFESYERCVTDISLAMHFMRTEELIYPPDITAFTTRIGDVLTVSADSFFGLSIVSSLAGFTSIWGLILSGMSSLIIGGFMHLITIVVIYEVRNMLLQNRSKSLSESKMDLIMKEIQVICC